MTEPRIYLVFGASFTGKTTFALGEDEDDVVDYFELEPGGYRRASSGIKFPERINKHKLRTPLTELEDIGRIVVGANGAAPQPAHHLEGWMEVYGDFLKLYMAGLKGPGRPVIDTATRLWLMVRQSFAEQLQKATGSDLVTLDQLKYTAPNARMTQVVEAPERMGKDIVLIAHEDTVFGTSILKADTFKEIQNMADVTLRFQAIDGKPVATIFKMGEGGMSLVGRQIVEPTLLKVNGILDAAAKLRGLKFPIPESNEEMVELAAGL